MKWFHNAGRRPAASRRRLRRCRSSPIFPYWRRRVPASRSRATRRIYSPAIVKPLPGTLRVPGTYDPPTMAHGLADILAPDLRCVLVGINPGIKSAEAGHHFANPRNDFWRLLADAGLTSRQLQP